MNEEELRIFNALPAIDEYTHMGKILHFLKDGQFIYYTKEDIENTIRGTYHIAIRPDKRYHVVTRPDIGKLTVSVTLHQELLGQ